MMDALRGVLASQLVSGGLMLCVIGALVSWGRNLPAAAWAFVRRRITTQVIVRDRCDAFTWMELWLAAHPWSKRFRWLQATVTWKEGTRGGTLLPTIALAPATGPHLIRHEGRFMIVWRSRREGDGRDRADEDFTIDAFGGGRDALLSVLEAARVFACPPGDTSVGVYQRHVLEWRLAAKQRPRPLATVVLADGVAERVCADLAAFYARPDWYTERGIPWRRGFLLEGPPGNGKTSLIRALASEFKRDVYPISLSAKMTDEMFVHVVSQVPAGHFLVIEDIDCAFTGRDGTNDSVTFAGLLNAIDGLATVDGRVLFLTTNHPEKLDPALTRPGRVDMRVHLGNATHEQIARMHGRFFPEASRAESEAFARTVPDGASMAAVQGMLLEGADGPRLVVSDCA